MNGKQEDLFNSNTIICNTIGNNIENTLKRFDAANLKRPIVFDGNIKSNLLKIYEYCKNNDWTHVTIFNDSSHPCKNIIEKYNNIKEFPESWDILVWSRRGDASGLWPINIDDLRNCCLLDKIGPKLKSSISIYNFDFLIINAYLFGEECFTIDIEAFPLFMDISEYYRHMDNCLTPAPYENFMNVYHLKELLVVRHFGDIWEYPLDYNNLSDLYRCGFYHIGGTKTPPIDFEI